MKKSPIPVAAVAVGAVALVGLAAAGWYMSRPGDTGMAELNPGEPTAVATAPAAPMAPMTSTPALETAQAPPAVNAGATERAAAAERTAPIRTAQAPRTRPAAAASATSGETAIDASGTAELPAGPQPYAGAATPSTATVDSPPAVTPAPVAPASPPVVTPVPIPEPIPADPATTTTP
ncbi:hypothetical protein [Phenylobacterium sp. J367]|uniref:hypothetical protein n=1 Tax=Phenylobacterium sp. J367 TaxID=2898435 RepID=UPI00215143CE|nr:hypothetical protein [Phenylobacterium sp. J367]MCR5877251.1 hypothetical protein [Phenylobacterium sp. J367]